MNNKLNNKQTNPIPVFIGIFLSVIFLVIGFINGSNYISTRYQPAMATKQVMLDLLTTQTLLANNIQGTNIALQSTQVAEAAQTQSFYAGATQTQQYNEILSLTPTPTPQLVSCQAKVTDKDGAKFSDIPGYYYNPSSKVTIPSGSALTVDGYLPDSNFVHVIYNEKPGFILRDALTFSDPLCNPLKTDLYFLAGWMSEWKWPVLVDDTFYTSRNLWSTYADNKSVQQIQIDVNQSDATLPVNALDQEVIFSTAILNTTNVSIFGLHTFVHVRQTGLENPYFGFRFFERDNSYYQIRLMPKSCTFQLLAGDKEIYFGNMKYAACADVYYSIKLSLDEDHILKLVVNGNENELDLSNLSIPLDPESTGGISFMVNNAVIDYKYIVAAAPR
jgi:hypothetical protein